MRILTVDVGTGTQDILLFDTNRAIENCIKMVMPAPTVIAAWRVQNATRRGMDILFTGVNMGGGPITTATDKHILAGYQAFALPSAAETFDDDMDMVQKLGVKLVSEDEATSIAKRNCVVTVNLRDLDLNMIRRSLESFDVVPSWDAIAVAVFDHGAAPPLYSDRKFRFDHLRDQMAHGKRPVSSFGYLANEIPQYLTRLRAVATCSDPAVPTLLMDTAEAAILGSLEDTNVSAHHNRLMVNIGNEHTLAFNLTGENIAGVFEHHTHVVETREVLEDLLLRLLNGNLTDEEVFKGMGHGCIVVDTSDDVPFLAVTGPLRGILRGSSLNPHFATPHGDMMLAGCFGLVRAFSHRLHPWTDEIIDALDTENSKPPPHTH